MARSDASHRNVLVVRLSALGDVAMTIPVLYPVCRAHPDTRFVMLTRKWPASMFHDRPDNLKVVGIDTKDYKGFLGMMRLARELRQQYDIDAVADLHSVLRTWMLGTCMRWHGIPVARLDKQRDRRKALIHHKAGEPITPTHERYREVFRQLGLDAPVHGFTRLFDGKPIPTSLMVLDKQPGQHWVAISPFSAHRGKVYPLPLMEQVVAQLSSRENYQIFLMGGGKDEKTALGKIARQYPHVLSLAEVKHGFLDEYALLSQCDLMVTMDSANMHLASLVGLEALTIWGATAPACGFLGYGQDASTDLQLDMECRPCSIYGERDCRYGDYRCLSGISPERVVERIVSRVEKK